LGLGYTRGGKIMETLEMTLRRDSLREKPKYKVKKVKSCRLSIWEKEMLKAEKYDDLVKRMERKGGAI